MKVSFPQIAKDSWTISKDAAHGSNGVVATQHYLASQVGIEVLRRGGNAVDASVAAGLALGTVEPWMSGIGGGGFMTISSHDLDAVNVVEFGMRAPLDSTQEDYPLTGKSTGASSFHWPEVKDNANVYGPLSIAVPGHIKGMALALERFGTWDWKDVIEPACQIAEKGLPVDWYASHTINSMARVLHRRDETRRVFLSDGLPPTSNGGLINWLPLGNLARTYRILQRDGPLSYYQGEIAELIVDDLQKEGSKIRIEDLNSYEAFVDQPVTIPYRDSQLYAPRRRCAGQTIHRTFSRLAEQWQSGIIKRPNPETYVRYVEALLEAYEYRLENLGDGPKADVQGATSHLCVGDKYGTIVSHTQTIMSSFGSHIMLPKTGIVMNNGMMWFDPRSGRPNSIAGGRRPLSNMSPLIGHLADGASFAIGACGGRMIFPAVFQIISFLCDFGMDVANALHQPRVDVSGTDLVTIMDSMDAETLDRLTVKFDNTRIRANTVSPLLFAVPQLVLRQTNGELSGGCFIPSPNARALAI